ncbi:uncharacterized protein L3040_001997 [Drepanopeziza brunnea f. sp. 'multigermtubi']|uniref:uncharacterized protein n=1 Tax=Drepanopeziza brunnea f. sp. 'multigermtubi' TaxID=698441 RepID=UPI00238BB91C|nr:hypothetical protein L3040_001997 [Drepanopeziza brunnea f. sp. 'multigermtubi']
MSASQIPNLLHSRGGPRIRGSRGRGLSRRGGRETGVQRKDLAIQSTDTDAAVSRLSAVSLGYLEDPIATYFVSGDGTRRMPIINRGTYTRTAALDILINAFLAHPDPESIPQTKQIISLGAGTDTRYFRLRSKNKHHSLVYHEFDFPSVSTNKRRIVSNNRLLVNNEDEVLFPEFKIGTLGSPEPDTEWGVTRTQVNLGFKEGAEEGGQEAETIENIWQNWVPSTEKQRVDALEGLDEVEEWQMLARHYCVAWGWRGSVGWDGWAGLRD